ncbi:uncharacterized protein LOC135468029 [Liolophura sinensis]|uniref:uncharacterized protein LOC135468029 n=1 Tax=Liolophura sinensis TaxID=3198878 RepID=UPI0031582B15
MHIMGFIFGIILTCLLANGVRSQNLILNGERSFTTSCGNSSLLINAWRYGGVCQELLEVWYEDSVRPSFSFTNQRRPLEYQDLATRYFWGKICKWGHTVGECYDSLLPQCEAGIGTELLNNPSFIPLKRSRCFTEGRPRWSSLQAFYRRTCQGTTVKPDIQQSLDDVSFDNTTMCLNSTHQIELFRCMDILNDEIQFHSERQYQASDVFRKSINRFATAAVNCMFSSINRSPCNQATKNVMYLVAKLQLPSFIDETELELDETTTADFSSIIRCTVGVYGDPHLKLCEFDGLVTCSAQGQQTYIKNDWFTVTGNNVRVGVRSNNPPITSMRSVEITFHSLDSGETVATYSGSNANLPTVFDNTNMTSLGEGNDKVTLSLNNYRQVMFVQESTGMVLNLRQWSGNYFFTLRVAQNVIKKSHGLLVTGCPESETISRSSLFRRPMLTRRKRATEDECENACNATVTDPYFRQTCKFDCYAMDDIDAGTNMTASAEEDIRIVLEMDEEIIAKAITPKPTTPAKTTPAPKTTTAKDSAPHSHVSYSVLLTAILGFVALKVFGVTK